MGVEKIKQILKDFDFENKTFTLLFRKTFTIFQRDVLYDCCKNRDGFYAKNTMFFCGLRNKKKILRYLLILFG